MEEKKGFNVNIIDFGFDKEYRKLIDSNIFVNNNAGINKDRVIYTLAHEIAHGYLHKDKGNTIDSPKHAEYEEEADRGAKMILDLLSIDFDVCVGGIK